MKLRNIIMLIVVLTTSLTSLFAQNSDQGFSCGHSEMQQKIWGNNPESFVQYENIIRNLDKYEAESDKKRGTKKYIIPIVFHILHENGDENISDKQVIDQIKILNRDFNKLNEDASTVHPDFKDIIANCNFEFRLPTKDPIGNCTNGINHYYSNLTNNGGENSKINQWNRAQYLNVWVVKSIGKAGVAGYAFFPGSAQGDLYKSDGIIIKHQYIGSIGTSTAYTSRALTHEIGHYLGLPHVWGFNNDPEEVCGDDGISDTPITKGYKTCPKLTNSNNSKTACLETTIFDYTFDSVTKISGKFDNTLTKVNNRITQFPAKANNVSLNSTTNKVFAFSNWPTGGKNNDTLTTAQSGKIDPTKYYEIKLLASKGNLMNADGLSFKLGRNTTGIKNLAIKSSIDTFKNNLPFTFTKKINPTANIDFRYDTIKCKKQIKTAPILSDNFTKGGFFTADKNVVIDSLTGVIDLLKIQPGKYTITYAVPSTNLTPAIYKTNSIVIIPEQFSKISYTKTDFCQSGSIKPNVQGFYGGIFTSSNSLKINPISGEIDLAQSLPGYYKITYSVNDENKCVTENHTNIKVSPNKLKSTAFSYKAFCKSQDTILPNKTDSFAVGGIFSTNKKTLIIDSLTGKINLKLSTDASYTVFYTVNATNCNKKSIDSTIIKIISDTVSTIKYTSFNVCDTASRIPVLTGIKSGVFSSNNGLSLDTKSGKININKSIPGLYEISYKTKSASGCEKIATTMINYSKSSFKDTLNKIKYSSYYFCNSIDSLTTPTITGNKQGKFSADLNLAIDSTGKINFKKSKQGIYEITYTSKGTNNCILEAKTKINFTTSLINDSINKINYAGYFFTDTNRVKPTLTGDKNGKFSSDSLFINTSGEIIFKDTKSKFGIHTIYYTTVSTEKCNLQASTSINYIDTNKYKPTIKLSYPTENCGNTKTISPTFAKDFVLGGTFTTNNNLIINSATGEIDLVKSKLDSSNYLIKYVLKIKSGTKQKEFKDSINIRIYNPTVKMSYAKVFYTQTDSVAPIFSGDRSGKYSAESGLAINTSTGIIKLKNSKTGNYVVNYSLNNVCHDTVIKQSVTILTPEVKLATNNELVFVKDTNNNLIVSITLGTKYKDLTNADTLMFRIYGWNAESMNGTLDIDSLRVFTKIGAVENYENFMEYSYCSKMFTNEQAKLMRYYLESPYSSRNNLWSQANLIATGVNDADMVASCKPKANFYMSLKKDKSNVTTNICAGNDLVFHDISENGSVTSRTWLFENGTPSTSKEAEPEVTFSKAGGHNVTLIVTNQNGTDTLSINNYVFVTTNASETGFLTENFEKGYSWDWKVEDFNLNSSRFALSNKNGKNNSKCLKLNNYRDISKYQSYQNEYYYYDRLVGTKHAIITPAINLTTTSNVTISFDYAFATNAYYDSLITDVLTVYTSRDCGETWTPRRIIGGPNKTTNSITLNTIVSAGNSSGAEFLPESDIVWKNVSFPLTVGSLDTKTRIKFEFVPSKYANNLFIDNVNINGTLQIEESPITKMGMNVFPNPVSATDNISISYEANDQDVIFELVDTQGKIVTKEINTTKNTTVNHTFENIKLNAGCYFVKATQGEFTSTFKVIVL
jgi:hypothetical protein